MRPGGLTALAVFNLFLSLGYIGSIFSLLNPQEVQLEKEEYETPEGETKDITIRKMVDVEVSDEDRGQLNLVAILSGVTGVLVLIAGIGYFRQSRRFGYLGGNAGAISGLLATGMTVRLPDKLGGGVTLDIIHTVFYFVLTLVLLNTVFRRDFVK